MWCHFHSTPVSLCWTIEELKDITHVVYATRQARPSIISGHIGNAQLKYLKEGVLEGVEGLNCREEGPCAALDEEDLSKASHHPQPIDFLECLPLTSLILSPLLPHLVLILASVVDRLGAT